MDYELELGAIIGKPVPHGESVLADDAGAHIFGFVILNDWSGTCAFPVKQGLFDADIH